MTDAEHASVKTHGQALGSSDSPSFTNLGYGARSFAPEAHAETDREPVNQGSRPALPPASLEAFIAQAKAHSASAFANYQGPMYNKHLFDEDKNEGRKINDAPGLWSLPATSMKLDHPR